MRLTKDEITNKLASDKNFRYCDLTETDLSGLDLSEANLYCANLREANLKKSRLSGAGLFNADLYRANLRGANLYCANLRKANLYRANLTNVNFRWLASGNNREVRTLQLGTWEVVLVFPTQVMCIGCQQHSFDEWFSFSDEEINQMHPRALSWWQTNKDFLKTIIDD